MGGYDNKTSISASDRTRKIKAIETRFYSKLRKEFLEDPTAQFLMTFVQYRKKRAREFHKIMRKYSAYLEMCDARDICPFGYNKFKEEFAKRKKVGRVLEKTRKEKNSVMHTER